MAKRGKAEPKTEPNPERVAAFNTGLSAESRAAAFLVAKGYRILVRRFRTPVGEIDIIARRFNTIAFVEVKARATLDGAAEAAGADCRGRSGCTRIRCRHAARIRSWLQARARRA